MTLYLLAYARELGTRAEIKACLDSLPSIESWRFEIPNTVFIKSNASAMEIGEDLRMCLGVERPRFLLVEIPPVEDNERNWGWLVPDSWTFLGKKPTEKEE